MKTGREGVVDDGVNDHWRRASAVGVLSTGETDRLAIARHALKLSAHSVASRLGHAADDDDVLTIAARREVSQRTTAVIGDEERVVSISTGQEVFAAVSVEGVVAWSAKKHVVPAQATDLVVTREPEDSVVLWRTVELITARCAFDESCGRALSRNAENQRQNERSSECRTAHISDISSRRRESRLLTGDAVLVAVEMTVRAIQRVASLEVRDRRSGRVISRADSPGAVRVTLVQR